MADSVRVVALSGDLTVETCRDTLGMIREALIESPTVVIDVNKIRTVDLSFVHVLYAAKKWACRNGKRLELAGEVADGVAGTLCAGGFISERVNDGKQLEDQLLDFSCGESN
ncbi:MAG: STAS domain-containing protein [Spirochaetaceae bacterium]|nr:MAG: STAS domain-containing protein [Spirochaetaceae bacterium]